MAEEDALTEEDLVVEHDEEESESTVDEEESAPTTGDDKDTEAFDVEAKLAELEASNKGLVKSLSAQRGIRQDLQSQLENIKEAIAEVKESRADVSEESTGSMVPIEYDDEGNPFLDTSSLGDFNKTEISALKATVNQLQQQINQTNIQKSEQQFLNGLLDEREGYTEAHKAVTKAWNFLKDDAFDAYLVEKGIDTPKTADQAIEIALNSKEISAEFSKRFPSLDMESVLEAHLIATPRYLRKALNKALVSKDLESSHASLDKTKPSSLASIDAGGGETQDSLLTRMADMPTEDFMKLDAATIAKIDRLLETKG